MIHKRKGVTLAEMAIVMAVIAIVSLSVVSFVMITSGRGTNSIAKLNAMEEIELVEAIIDNWFAINAKDGTPLEPDKSIEVDKGALQVGFANDQLMSYPLEKVTDIEFAMEKQTQKDEKGNDVKDESGNVIVLDTIYFCTVTYVQEEDAREQTYTFCINPRVGETIVPELTGATTEQEAQQ